MLHRVALGYTVLHRVTLLTHLRTCTRTPRTVLSSYCFAYSVSQHLDIRAHQARAVQGLERRTSAGAPYARRAAGGISGIGSPRRGHVRATD